MSMDIKNSLLSAVVPCFNEEDNIIPFYEEFIKNECFFKENDIRFEIIFVDDGSEDSTEDRIKELNMKDRRVGLVSLCDAILFTSADIYMELQDNCDINDMIFIVRKSTGQPSYRYSSISKYWKESDVAISENPDRPETVKIHVKNPEQVVYLPDNGLYIDRPLKRW